MKKALILQASALSLFFLTSFANAAIVEDHFTCSSRVNPDSRFACVNEDQFKKYTNYHPGVDDGRCPASTPPTSTPFTVTITNTGKHWFTLHRTGVIIKPGQSVKLENVKYHYNDNDGDCYGTGWGTYDDTNVINIYRADIYLTKRTLTAKVDITYTLDQPHPAK